MVAAFTTIPFHHSSPVIVDYNFYSHSLEHNEMVKWNVFYRVAVKLHKQKVAVQLLYKQSGLLLRTLPYTLSKWNVYIIMSHHWCAYRD